MNSVRVRTGTCFGLTIVLVFLLISLSSSSTQAANFATHGGLAEDTYDNDFFISGAMLADIDKFLPPGNPQTDSLAFTLDLIERARDGSNDLRLFVWGWYEHLEQDEEFYNSELAIQAVYPGYTDADIRLAFDYLSTVHHPISGNVTFIMNHTEIVEAIQAGLTNATIQDVQQAIWDYVYSTDISAPGLLTQIQAAQLYAAVYPDRITNMEPEYHLYVQKVTESYRNPFLGDFTFDAQNIVIGNMQGGHRPDPDSVERSCAEKMQEMSHGISRYQSAVTRF